MASTRPETAPSVVDRITHELRNRIKRGHLVGGQRLIEVDWTREFGVSRGPVREALGRLASEGLVVVEPKRGAVVRRLTPKDIYDLYEARAALEGQAAALAARCIRDADHTTRLRELLRENAKFLRGGEFVRYLPVNERFHHLVLELADNQVIERLAGQLHAMAYHLQATRVARATAPSPVLSVAGSAKFHREIGGAILVSDEVAADQLMRRHIYETRDGILAVDQDTPRAIGLS